MKHIFIVNPKAGQKRKVKDFLLHLQLILQKREEDCEIIMTTETLSAGEITRRVCESHDNNSLRIYACGGDGTLHDILQKLVSYPDVELACVPLGSGNDFVRNFPDVDFFDIENQFLAKPTTINVLEARGEFGMRYVLNVISFAWESKVAMKASDVKKWPLVSGSMSYIISVIINLIGKKPIRFSAKINDKIIEKDDYLIGAFGNGAYYGGGFKGATSAVLNDDLFDAVFVKDITRREFAHLFPVYMRGEHRENDEIKPILTYEQTKKATIYSDEPMPITLDGEGYYSQVLECIISDKHLKFVIPKPNI